MSYLWIQNFDQVRLSEIKRKLYLSPTRLAAVPDGQTKNISNNKLLLSSASNWDKNCDEVIDLLPQLFPIQANVKEQELDTEISVIFDMKEYAHRNLTCFSFGVDFLKTLAQYQMSLCVTIINENGGTQQPGM